MDKNKQKFQKVAVFALMGVLFVGSMWIIFSPTAKDKTALKAQLGLNAEIPDPKNEGIVGDKRNAYENEQQEQTRAERMRTLSDFSELFTVDRETEKEREERQINMAPKPPEYYDNPAMFESSKQSRTRENALKASASAYANVSQTLDSFYETPPEDTEKEQLRRQVEESQAENAKRSTADNSMDSQLELMERSFQMAAKYIPGATETVEPSTATKANVSGKMPVAPVARVQEQVVSALLPEMSDAGFIHAFSEPRNMGFLTVANESDVCERNTISACILSNQTVTDGQNVRIRLLEPMSVGSSVVPRNSILSATAKIAGERLQIEIESLEFNGMVMPVSLMVYDTDGQSGIFIPDLQALSATKEIVASMGQSAGTSVNLSNNAGGQFVADMGRNLIQGVSQFTAKKLREVKVHLKAGYRVLLLPKES